MRLTPGEKKSAIPSPTMNLRTAACEEPAGYLEEHESEEEARGENAKSRHIGFQLDGHWGKNGRDVVPVDSVHHPRDNQLPKCAALGHVSQQMLRQVPTRFSYSGSDNSSIDAVSRFIMRCRGAL